MNEVAPSERNPDPQPIASRSSEPLRVLIAASGTGGHLIPAVHIANAIRDLHADAVIEFIGAGRPLEETLIVQKGFTRHVVPSVGVKQGGIGGMIRFILNLPFGLLGCRRLYRRFNPDVVVGVGGYVSVLPVIAARLSGIPTWTHEAELRPGLANRCLGYFADRMSLAFSETVVKGRVSTLVTGHPVRSELGAIDRSVIREDAPKRLLVLGGSQGARALDEAVEVVAETLRTQGVEVVHQCRPENMDRVLNSYRVAKVSASVVSFIENMAGAYEWSDVIISRAGASSVAEIACVNRPAIFVPYPYQQGTHQTDNARSLVTGNKALLVEETEPEFGTRLRDALNKILDRDTYRAMKAAPLEPRGLGAAAAIAQGISDLARR